MNQYLDSTPSMTLGEAMQKMRAAEPETIGAHQSIDTDRSISDAIAVLWRGLEVR
jgi:hypothetical protein